MPHLTTRSTLRRGAALAAAVIVAPLLALAAPVAAGTSIQVTVTGAAGYGYVAPGPSDSVYVTNYEAQTLTQIAADGATTTWGCYKCWALTTGLNGSTYVDSYYGNELYTVNPPGVFNLVGSGDDYGEYYGMAVDAGGNVYFGYGSDTTIYKLTPTGALSTFATNDGTEAIAIDPSGNLYSTSTGDEIFKTTPTGQVSVYATVPGATFYGIAYDPISHVVYAGDTTSGDIDAFSPDGAPTVAVTPSELPGDGYSYYGLGFDSAGDLYVADAETQRVYKVAGLNQVESRVQGLEVDAGVDSLTATWAAGGGTEQCTLMYGYDNPSTFTQTVSGTTCTFTGLDPHSTYGIAVSPVGAGATSSLSAVGFAQPLAPSITITCVRRHKTRHITGTATTCPVGWHRVN